MHIFCKKKKEAQQPLHGRSDTPNYWKKKEKMSLNIVSLHDKSDKPNSGKKKKA